MITTLKESYRISVIRTILRFSIIGIWFIIMVYASYMGLFIHAFIGMLSLIVLTFLTIKQFEARARYYKKKREQAARNYHVGEDYLEIFSANK